MPRSTTAPRERILSAATRLFAESGFAGASLSSIADQAGVSKPTLLYHFSSKEALRGAVLDALLSPWKEMLPRLLLEAASGWDRFDRVVNHLLAFFEESPDRARLVLRECLDRPESVKERLRDQLRPWLALVEGYIERGQQEGRVRPEVRADAYLVQVITMVVTHFAAGDVFTALSAEGSPDIRPALAAEITRMARTALFVDRPRTRKTS